MHWIEKAFAITGLIMWCWWFTKWARKGVALLRNETKPKGLSNGPRKGVRWPH